MSILWIVLLLFILVLTGVPIVYSFGISSLVYFIFMMSTDTSVLVSRTFGSLDSFTLLAVPFFIFAGNLMRDSNIADYLINFFNIFIRKLKGGLGHLTVVTSTFFGAISGSAAAAVAAIGGIMIPSMIKKGYRKDYAVVIGAASGSIGVLIPPSIPIIIYGMTAEVSVARLFLAGIIPGILLTLAFILVNKIMYKKSIEATDSTTEEKSLVDRVNKRQNNGRAIAALIMPLIILGGIYSGIFTPTEAGAVAVFYSILVGFLYYRTLTVGTFLKSTSDSALSSGIILIMVGFGGVFGYIITVENVPFMLTETILSVTENTILILLILNILYLIIGSFLETITAILITTPIFLPLIQSLGLDPVHFGIIMVTNLAIGLITPPFALNLLIASKIGNIPALNTLRAIIPYFIVAIIVLLLVTYIPSIALFLPNLLM